MKGTEEYPRQREVGERKHEWEIMSGCQPFWEIKGLRMADTQNKAQEQWQKVWAGTDHTRT